MTSTAAYLYGFCAGIYEVERLMCSIGEKVNYSAYPTNVDVCRPGRASRRPTRGNFGMLVRGKTPSLMVGHGSVRHSPNLEGLAVHVLLSLSLSLSKKKKYVLCCAVKISTWVGTHLATLIPNRPGRGNLIWCRCAQSWSLLVTPAFVTPKCLLVCNTVHNDVLRSCHQYVIIPT